jgi:hypothetical protein
MSGGSKLSCRSQGGPIGTIRGSTDASLHCGSNETIGGRSHHRRPEIVKKNVK